MNLQELWGKSNIVMFYVLAENSNFPNYKGKINVWRGKIGTESEGASQVDNLEKKVRVGETGNGKALCGILLALFREQKL